MAGNHTGIKMRLRIVEKRASEVADNLVPAITAKPTTSHGAKLLRFDATMDLNAPGVKTFTIVKNADGEVTDFRDVEIKGYLSTFGNTDRDGEFVEPGAFAETIPMFLSNPVLLINHRNDTESQAGSFSVVREDSKGLYVEARLTNSPVDSMRHVRALVAEGHLKTMSMGGIFYYREDRRAIFKVQLFEGSLTPVPANPMALISTREASPDDLKRVSLPETVRE